MTLMEEDTAGAGLGEGAIIIIIMVLVLVSATLPDVTSHESRAM